MVFIYPLASSLLGDHSSYQTVSKSKKLLTDNQLKSCTKVKGQNALRCWISGALRHSSTSYLFLCDRDVVDYILEICKNVNERVG